MRARVAGRDVYIHTAQHQFDRHAPSILLIHGAGQDHTIWRLQVRALVRRGWNAMAVDLPGHGRSDGEPAASIGDLAAWALALLDEVPVDRSVVVGHSMGALVALEMVLEDPDRVAALVLTGAADRMPVHPDLLTLARAGDPDARDLIVGWVHTGDGRMGAGVQPGVWEPGVTRRTMGPTPAVLAVDLGACDEHRFEGLDSIACPVTVVAGEGDRMAPVRSARRLADAIPGARFVVIPGVGHDLVSRAHRTVTDLVVEQVESSEDDTRSS